MEHGRLTSSSFSDRSGCDSPAKLITALSPSKGVRKSLSADDMRESLFINPVYYAFQDPEFVKIIQDKYDGCFSILQKYSADFMTNYLLLQLDLPRDACILLNAQSAEEGKEDQHVVYEHHISIFEKVERDPKLTLGLHYGVVASRSTKTKIRKTKSHLYCSPDGYFFTESEKVVGYFYPTTHRANRATPSGRASISSAASVSEDANSEEFSPFAMSLDDFLLHAENHAAPLIIEIATAFQKYKKNIEAKAQNLYDSITTKLLEIDFPESLEESLEDFEQKPLTYAQGPIHCSVEEMNLARSYEELQLLLEKGLLLGGSKFKSLRKKMNSLEKRIHPPIQEKGYGEEIVLSVEAEVSSEEVSDCTDADLSNTSSPQEKMMQEAELFEESASPTLEQPKIYKKYKKLSMHLDRQLCKVERLYKELQASITKPEQLSKLMTQREVESFLKKASVLQYLAVLYSKLIYHTQDIYIDPEDRARVKKKKNSIISVIRNAEILVAEEFIALFLTHCDCNHDRVRLPIELGSYYSRYAELLLSLTCSKDLVHAALLIFYWTDCMKKPYAVSFLAGCLRLSKKYTADSPNLASKVIRAFLLTTRVPDALWYRFIQTEIFPKYPDFVESLDREMELPQYTGEEFLSGQLRSMHFKLGLAALLQGDLSEEICKLLFNITRFMQFFVFSSSETRNAEVIDKYMIYLSAYAEKTEVYQSAMQGFLGRYGVNPWENRTASVELVYVGWLRNLLEMLLMNILLKDQGEICAAYFTEDNSVKWRKLESLQKIIIEIESYYDEMTEVDQTIHAVQKRMTSVIRDLTQDRKVIKDFAVSVEYQEKLGIIATDLQVLIFLYAISSRSIPKHSRALLLSGLSHKLMLIQRNNEHIIESRGMQALIGHWIGIIAFYNEFSSAYSQDQQRPVLHSMDITSYPKKDIVQGLVLNRAILPSLSVAIKAVRMWRENFELTVEHTAANVVPVVFTALASTSSQSGRTQISTSLATLDPCRMRGLGSPR